MWQLLTITAAPNPHAALMCMPRGPIAYYQTHQAPKVGSARPCFHLVVSTLASQSAHNILSIMDTSLYGILKLLVGNACHFVPHIDTANSDKFPH